MDENISIDQIRLNGNYNLSTLYNDLIHGEVAKDKDQVYKLDSPFANKTVD